ncbi:MAG: formate dehydrogenase family accessory protein FdhD [Tardiphaga sp.]|nr:formate dehydrogenase family accessory protein FdhD [Tardiphaga sp.]
MNQPLQRYMQADLVSVVVSATCDEGGIRKSRLVCVAEETPVAFRYSGFAHAVMMATPCDLEDFAAGFSISEGVIESCSDCPDVAVSHGSEGITVDIPLTGRHLHRYLAGRRIRQMRGHTSCGLCGVEDLKDVARPQTRVTPSLPLDAELIVAALAALRQWQPLSRLTRCAHASAWVNSDGNLHTVREDVGRHNSLDKLIGALARGGARRPDGFCLVTSRCSFEMVQKAVAAGFPGLVSAGAPTAQAIRLAAAAGLTLYSLSRDGEPLLFTSPSQENDT